MTLLEVDNVHTQFETADGTVRAVDGVSFDVDSGETVAIVGESGCGKSVTAQSILGLQDPGEITQGSIRFDGQELTDASPRTRRRIRGSEISMVFQDPNTTLNPAFDVGEQIAESIRVHREPDSQSLLDFLHAPLFADGTAWNDARDQALELMEQVDIASPADRIDDYPHELSGGMRQRAMLAIALASNPQLLIADEPTTALDTTTQAQLLERLDRLSDERGLAVLLITHDLSVVAERSDRVVVMYAGEVMETGPTERLLTDPRHPYTRALLSCLTHGSEPKTTLPTIDGTVPDLADKPPGCPFAPRCEHSTDSCRRGDVPVVTLEEGHARCGEPIVFESGVDGGPADTASTPRHSSPSDTDAADSSSRETVADSGNRLTTADSSGGETAACPADRNRSTELGDREPLVELAGVSKRYPLDDGLLARVRGETRALQAVDDVDLRLLPGETLALVGESGCGKSTLANLLTGLETPTGGTIRLDGDPVGPADERDAETLADVGVVFQDPRASVNPRLTVRDAIAEPLQTQGVADDDREQRLTELLALVDLQPTLASSYPHELSGGQIQRVAIARAIASNPQLVVLDEPVSALDASVQAQILNLLGDLQRDLGLTYLFVSHDLDVVRHVADRVAVMYLGQLMEVGPADRLLSRPAHPYTECLLEAVPSLDPTESSAGSLEGDVPTPIDPPNGCVFHTRCPVAEPRCENDEPTLAGDGPASKCHFATELVADRRSDSVPVPDADD